MLEPEEAEDETFINIRRLAALDIAFHGPKFILAEFGFGVVFLVTIALLGLMRGHARSPFMILVSCYFLLLALNYLPLLLYAILIMRKKSAQEEVAFELAHKAYYARKYGFQQLLLVVPLIVPILAISQELRRRSGS